VEQNKCANKYKQVTDFSRQVNGLCLLVPTNVDVEWLHLLERWKLTNLQIVTRKLWTSTSQALTYNLSTALVTSPLTLFVLGTLRGRLLGIERRETDEEIETSMKGENAVEVETEEVNEATATALGTGRGTEKGKETGTAGATETVTEAIAAEMKTAGIVTGIVNETTRNVTAGARGMSMMVPTVIMKTGSKGKGLKS